MMDPERLSEAGKVNRIKITKDERLRLMNKLEDIFGNQIKGGPKTGQIPVIASASFIYFLLDAPNLKSSDAK